MTPTSAEIHALLTLLADYPNGLDVKYIDHTKHLNGYFRQWVVPALEDMKLNGLVEMTISPEKKPLWRLTKRGKLVLKQEYDRK